jgi:predicted transcriptional regulator
MTVPRRLDPVLDVRVVSLAGGFRQAREFVIQVVVDEFSKRERFGAQGLLLFVEATT